MDIVPMSSVHELPRKFKPVGRDEKIMNFGSIQNISCFLNLNPYIFDNQPVEKLRSLS